MIIPASILLLVAVAFFVWTVLDVIYQPRTVDPQLGRFEEDRRDQLRSSNFIYRLFEPIIDEWDRMLKPPAKKLADTEDFLRGAGITERWSASEYLNVKRLESLFIAVSSMLIGLTILGLGFTGAILLAILVFFVHQWLVVRTLKSLSIVRQMKMKRRFAGAIDLMALMMEVGAGFQECLQVAAREAKGTPLGDELALVEKEIQMGSLRSKALTGLADRTRDVDMSEVIMSINEGEELGTPLTAILRNQADQMRQKRSQWAERAAEESQVAIVFPAMLIMVACLLIVIAPFVLTVISGEA